MALLRDFKIKGLIGKTVDLTLHPGALRDPKQRLQKLQQGLLEDEPGCRRGSLRLGERTRHFGKLAQNSDDRASDREEEDCLLGRPPARGYAAKRFQLERNGATSWADR